MKALMLAAAATMLFAARVTHADPTQLPKKCAADSPTDEPCTKIGGRYRIELSPREGGKTCVLKKRASAVLTVRSEGRTPKFDAKPLLKALGLKPRKADPPELGAAIREGVCCLDLRLYGQVGNRSQRIMVHMAAGTSIVNAKADDRWVEDDPGNDMCGDEDLDVNVTRLKP